MKNQKIKHITIYSKHITAVIVMESIATAFSVLIAIICLLCTTAASVTSNLLLEQSETWFSEENGWMGLFSLAGAGLVGFAYLMLLVIAVMTIIAAVWFLIFTIISICSRYRKTLFRVCVIIGQAPLAINVIKLSRCNLLRHKV